MIILFTKLAIDNSIKKVLQDNVPNDIIQRREGAGRQMLSYVSGNYVIDELNRAFNYAWSWSIDKAWVQESADHRKKVWANGKPTGEYNVEKVGPVAHVIGTLTVQLIDMETKNIIEIKKTAAGSKSIVGSQKWLRNLVNSYM